MMPNIIKKFCQNTDDLKTCKPIWVVASVSVFISLFAIAGLSYQHGFEAANAEPLKENLALKKERKRKKIALEKLKQQQQRELDAFAQKLGQLQAQLLRVEALGGRLISIGELDQNEFDFATPPPQGGPADSFARSLNAQELRASIATFATNLHDRENQLQVLERVLVEQNLFESIYPSGYPVRKGWVSSKFGGRKDPFTGKRSYHKGIDIAGKSGSDILAVGAGVVTYSGLHGGHGRMVEILHGSGLVTRYAHNVLNLVDVGDTVKKGEVISLMGQSGRSTGPHLHFEVLRDSKHVNPARYLKSQI